MQNTLLDALARAKKMSEVLSEQLNQTRAGMSAGENPESVLNNAFWESDGASASSVNYNVS